MSGYFPPLLRYDTMRCVGVNQSMYDEKYVTQNYLFIEVNKRKYFNKKSNKNLTSHFIKII